MLLSFHLFILYHANLNKKENIIESLILDKHLDFFFMTETWLRPSGDEVRISQMTPVNCSSNSFPRLTGQGGGICVTHSNLFGPSCISIDEYASFEMSKTHITINNVPLTIFCIYRPPPSVKNQLTNSIFINDFENFLDTHIMPLDKFLIIGDFNLHFDCPNDTYVKKCLELFDVRNLLQHTMNPTHKANHIIDWVVTSKHFSDFKVNVFDNCISDHFLLTFTLDFVKPKKTFKEIMSRDIRAICFDDLCFDLALSCATCISLSDACKASVFTSEIAAVFDRHAPLRARRVTDRPSAPWMTSELKSLKAEKRRAERKWRKTGLEQHKLVYKQLLAKFNSLINKCKKLYFESKITAASTSKYLFDFVSEMYGKSKKCIFPNNISIDKLPELLNNYFISKISKIRSSFDTQKACDTNSNVLIFNGNRLSNFDQLSQKEIKSIILSSPCKSCSLDPLPSNILFEHIDLFIHCITSIVNESLINGVMPLCFRKAVISPLLKKPSLDFNELKNYRPVSNLPFLSKIIEKAVACQLNDHISRNNLLEKHQSAYRKCHNTETALIKISNDLLISADNKNVSILALLDLSAAFDTLDHSILLNRLRDSFGLDGTVLQWFQSYLSDRRQCVKVNNICSNELSLSFGVPQGSVLGPLLYTLYTAPLGEIIRKHDLNYHFYADDTQLYLSIQPNDINVLVFKMEKCILEVKEWMHTNKLKLNEDKTEVILINPKNYDVNVSNLLVGDEDVHFSDYAKNLGVFIDKDLTMDCQITNLSKAVYLEIRRLKHISNFVDENCLKTLAASFILSRLDYCNSLYKNLNKYQIEKLQKLQNFAAKVVSKKSLYDHVTPILIDLHWLPISFRVDFKIAVLAFKCIHNLAPSYLSDLVEIYSPNRSLRSSSLCLLKPIKTKFRKLGDKSFSFTAPKVWNVLPVSLRQEESLSVFKSKLKTYYFKKAYF